MLLVFDLDGTLVDSFQAHVDAWIAAIEAFGLPPVDRKYVESLMGLPAKDIAVRLAPHAWQALVELKNEIFLRGYLCRVVAYPDALAALECLKEHRKVVVTSSSGYVARRILENTGISTYFELVVGGDEVERGKPSPEPLLYVSKRTGVDVRDMVVIGDSHYDVEMALAAGAVPVFVARRGGRDDRAITIPGLTHLPEVVEELKRGRFRR